MENVENVNFTDFYGVILPTIDLSTLNGRAENWLEFRDSFQRPVYLKVSLQSETTASVKVCIENSILLARCESCTDKRSLHEHTLFKPFKKKILRI